MSLNPDIRSEVETPTNLFYVISEGYAADHLFSWFSKSLNKYLFLNYIYNNLNISSIKN